MNSIDQTFSIIKKCSNTHHGDIIVPYDIIPNELEDNFENCLESLIQIGRINFFEPLLGQGYIINL